MSNADNIMILEIARKFSAVPPGLPGIRFRSLRGGQAADTLPREAKLLLTAPDCSDFRQRIAAYKQETGHDITQRIRGKSLEIAAACGDPGCERNAVSVLMDFAGALPFAGEEINEFIDFYNTYIHFGSDGAAWGIDFTDRIFLNAGMIDMTPEAARLILEIQCPSCCLEEHIFEALMPILNRYDMGLLKPVREKECEPDTAEENN